MSAQKSKFEGIDFTTITPELFDPRITIKGFRCSRREVVTYLRGDLVKREQNAGLALCWVLKKGEVVVGYITLLSDKLSTSDSRYLLKEENIKRTSFPAIKIGLLAIDERAKGKGVGKHFVHWAIAHTLHTIAPKVGVRFITVDAIYDHDSSSIYDAGPFYEKVGFSYANPDESLPPLDGLRTMYLDINAFR